MSGGTAADWAARADATALAVRRDEIDRRALADLPETRDALADLGVRAAHELRRWRDARLARLADEEPGVAAILRPRRGVTAGYLAASLAVAVAYALFFSRGNLGLEAEVIASAVALAFGAGAMALAAPWSPRRRATAADATMAWIVAGFGGAAAIATAVQAERAGGGPAVAVAIALAGGIALVGMAGMTTVRRLRTPRGVREREAVRAAEVRDELGEAVARARRDGGEQVAAALARSDPDAVEHARAELAAAYAVLARRGLVAATATPHEPGMLLIDDPLGRAARAIGLPDRDPLVPALARAS
ncbi:hypothetical protein [Agromyces sp. GXS1127]|uniref:hypothetical protein n=1 Tax=Agromyces sp. GXS1127 TaxID=3424181 RepID=UPI003D321D04